MDKFDIGIVGLGWLGFPLYKCLLDRGFRVCGSKTTAQDVVNFKAGGINVFQLQLNPEPKGELLNEWLNCRTLVINIPPSRSNENIEEHYPAQLYNLLKMVSPQTKVVFVGSTSVFGEVAGKVDDDSPFHPETPSAKALVTCEKWLGENRPESVIVRFAGLYGPGRHPGRFFGGRTAIPNGDAPINFIHQADAVRVLEKIITEGHRNLHINACAPQHPSKNEYYQKAALAGDYELPAFLTGGAGGRIVLTNWLNKNGFEFEKGVYSFD